MDFSKLRHRITFLKPVDDFTNSMGESVVAWQVYNPAKHTAAKIYLQSDDNGNIVFADGAPPVGELKPFEVWASAVPQTGREYTESQKIRNETTYNVITRYFDGISADMKILFRSRIFDIVSVLNIDSRNEQLKIIATERDSNGS